MKRAKLSSRCTQASQREPREGGLWTRVTVIAIPLASHLVLLSARVVYIDNFQRETNAALNGGLFHRSLQLGLHFAMCGGFRQPFDYLFDGFFQCRIDSYARWFPCLSKNSCDSREIPKVLVNERHIDDDISDVGVGITPTFHLSRFIRIFRVYVMTSGLSGRPRTTSGGGTPSRSGG